jgi:hypothetical protein
MMLEKTQGSVKLLAVPLHGRLPCAGGFPATGEAAGELVARTDAHEERTSAAFEWDPGQEAVTVRCARDGEDGM